MRWSYRTLAYLFYNGVLFCGIMDAITYFLFWLGYGYGYGEVPRWAFAAFMFVCGGLGLFFTKSSK
jgi:hypothetical protein